MDDTVYNAIEGVRARFTSALSHLLDSVDVLLCPNMVGLAPTVAEMDTRAASQDERAAFTTFTAPFDYSGHPTLSLPVGLHNGLPKTIQLIARQWGEERLIAVGSALERQVGQLVYPSI